MARVKVLRRFTKNMDGRIVHGNPDSKHKTQRILEDLSEDAARLLVNSGLGTRDGVPQSLDEVDAALEDFDDDDRDGDEGEGQGVGGGDTGNTEGNVEGADSRGELKDSAQSGAERRMAGKPRKNDVSSTTGKRGRQAAKKTPSAGRGKGPIPVGGSETTAVVGHPATSGAHAPPEGRAQAPVGDEAPTEGDDGDE